MSTCMRCGACCRWSGYVCLTSSDIAALADMLDLEVELFTSRFTRLLPNRAGLALIEKPDGSCVFLEGNLCSVHKAKPRQCRGFPQAWNFPGYEFECKAARAKTER